MSVSLVQKGSSVAVTVSVDCSELLSSLEKTLDDVSLARVASLDRVELTQDQRDAENEKYDLQTASEKRQTQLKMFDLLIKELSAAQTSASFSDEDATKELAATQLRAEAEVAKKVASRPTVDLDILK